MGLVVWGIQERPASEGGKVPLLVYSGLPGGYMPFWGPCQKKTPLAEKTAPQARIYKKRRIKNTVAATAPGHTAKKGRLYPKGRPPKTRPAGKRQRIRREPGFRRCFLMEPLQKECCCI